MLKTGDTKRRLGIMMMVLAVLVVVIADTGYADPTEQLSGPAVVGTLQALSDGTFTFNGHCRGNPATFTATRITTPEGFRFNNIGDSVCRDQQIGRAHV